MAPEQGLPPDQQGPFQQACAEASRIRALELPRYLGGTILGEGQALVASRTRHPASLETLGLLCQEDICHSLVAGSALRGPQRRT